MYDKQFFIYQNCMTSIFGQPWSNAQNLSLHSLTFYLQGSKLSLQDPNKKFMTEYIFMGNFWCFWCTSVTNRIQ